MPLTFRCRIFSPYQPILSASLLALLLCSPNMAQTPSIAATPPMGWNSWNHFAGKIDDATVRAQADAMVSTGMRDAGYLYINIDDTWEAERDAQGVIHTNSKFPDMKALADYVHGKGIETGNLLITRPENLRRVCGELRPRRARRANLRVLGHRLSKIRSL